MITKLEILVGYLAGRQSKAIESIRRELEDPTSESSRWLQAVQKRSRAVSRLGSPVPQGLIASAPMRNGSASSGSVRKRLAPFVTGLSAASLVLISIAVAWRAQDNRLLRLETTLAEREARLATRLEHLDTALPGREVIPKSKTPSVLESVSPQANPAAAHDGPSALALARIEARLGEVGDRLRESQSSQNQSDPAIEELRREVERLRKDVETRAQSSRLESQALSLVVQEVLDLLRRLAMRPLAPEPMQVPVPVPLQEHRKGPGRAPGLMPGTEQMQGQGQFPDQDQPHMDPGQRNQERNSPGFSGGSPFPRIQRPGGPG